MERRETTDDLDALMEALPPEICERLRALANSTDRFGLRFVAADFRRSN